MKARHIFYMILMTGCLLANLSACTFASKTTETERQIKVPAPLRPAGQTDVVGLACEPIDSLVWAHEALKRSDALPIKKEFR